MDARDTLGVIILIFVIGVGLGYYILRVYFGA